MDPEPVSRVHPISFRSDEMKRLFEKIEYIDLFLWLIRAVIIIIVIWGTVATILDNPYSTRQWTDFVIFGVAQGSRCINQDNVIVISY